MQYQAINKMQFSEPKDYSGNYVAQPMLYEISTFQGK
jgi:hypothetical protein